MRYCREKLLHVFLWCFLSKHPVRHPQLETQFDEMGLWSATLQVLLWVECLLAQLSLHVEKRLYGYIQIIWEIRSKCSCCGKEIFSGSNLRILLEMLNIWQLLRILWAVTMGLFPGLISVLLPKCSCLSVHPALYRKVAEQTDSTGACRTVCNIQRPTSSVPKQGTPSASWVEQGNWE